MDRRRLFLALLWPTALVVLVGVLAFFQYRWLGQVSDADRDRQRSTLNQRAREFAADFDREIGRIYSAMQFDPGAAPDATSAFAKHYADWKDAAAFPQLIGAIYLTGDGSSSQAQLTEDAPVPLTKFDPATNTFVAAEWPHALVPARERITTLRHKFTAPTSPFSSTGNTTFRFVSVGQTPVIASIPALMIPVQTVRHFATATALTKEIFDFEAEPRYVIVELDKQVMTGTLLPALVEKHLAVDDYHVEVLESHDGAPSTPVFRKGLSTGANLNPATADASTMFFNVRVDSIAMSAMRGVPSVGAVTMPLPPGDASVSTSGGRMSIVVSEATPDAKTGAIMRDTRASALERKGVESVLQNRATVMGRGPAGGGGSGGSFTYGGPWQLVLQHPAGSLEAAVTKARRRNLGISFGVLAVLSVSVFLISINAQRSKQLAAQQMDFVATVSHELRTPIAVIRSAAQNLSAGVIHDAARAKKYGELIDTEGRRLTDMVEEVLEFAGISGGKRQFAIAPTDVGRLTTEVMASCEALISDAGFVVELAVAPGLPMVNLDESAYRRALSNLVTNALKYATEGKWLAVTVFEAPDHQIAVSVADKGRGVDAKDLPHIFEAFYRGSYAKDRQIHGNGLGLSLVKRIVDAHGGSVSVQTSASGSTFTMKFHEAS